MGTDNPGPAEVPEASRGDSASNLAYDGAAKSVQELVDEAEVEFGGGVGLDDVDLEAIAYSRQPEDVDQVRRESIFRRTTAPNVAQWLRERGVWEADRFVRTPSNRRLKIRSRLCVPVRWDGELLGFLWLSDAPRRREDEVEAAVIYAGRIAGALAHERFLEERDHELDADCVRRLLRGESPAFGPPSVLAGQRDLYVAVALIPSFESDLARASAEAGLRKSLEQFRRRLAPRPLIFSVEAGEVLFVIGHGPGGDTEIREDFEGLRSWLGDSSVRIGISEPREGLNDLAAAGREAHWSAEAAGAIAPSGCVNWASLGAGRTLFKLLGGRDAAELIPVGVRRLRDADGGESLLSTLETYLEAGGDSKATAAAFSIHRNTLYQRLRRIEEISGLDLKRGDDRLTLHMGIRLLRLESTIGTVQ